MSRRTWLGAARRKSISKTRATWGRPILVTGLTGGPLAGGRILLRTSCDTLTISCLGQVGRYEHGLWVPA